jgi:hypothetical protein
LKPGGFKLWVNLSTAPPVVHDGPPRRVVLVVVRLLHHVVGRDRLRHPLGHVHALDHDVAAQHAFERHVLKPGLMFTGTGLKPVAFKLWVNRLQRAPPRHDGVLLLVLLPRGEPRRHRDLPRALGIRCRILGDVIVAELLPVIFPIRAVARP